MSDAPTPLALAERAAGVLIRAGCTRFTLRGDTSGAVIRLHNGPAQRIVIQRDGSIILERPFTRDGRTRSDVEYPASPEAAARMCLEKLRPCSEPRGERHEPREPGAQVRREPPARRR